ncbi:MAG TPA: PIG-L deacetylase family protein [Solimonas sp.]|nr:PIG-L deacetylase family protein [Solimonas sp.]
MIQLSPAEPSSPRGAVLLVVAHPDDEVLGCGGTAARLARQGYTVRSCMLSGNVAARRHNPGQAELAADTLRAQALLGLGEPILGEFPNIRFNTVAHLELVQFIEAAIVQTGATTVFTHHPADLNNDHVHTSLACQAAVRLFQRRADVPALQALYFMEVPSSTDWTFPNGTAGFQPTVFCPVGETLSDKLAALAAYRGVMRPYPHPRSEEAIRALAVMRGAQAGLEYAEAFQCAFRVLD